MGEILENRRICNPNTCELLNLREDFGLYRVVDNYEPTTVESFVLNRNDDNSGLGSLYFRGVYICDTLENPAYFMPLGIYEMNITYSPRFLCNLPLIKVPKHSGVRIHAANYISQLKGCVAVGVRSENILQHSKMTLSRVIRIIKECDVHYFNFVISYA